MRDHFGPLDPLAFQNVVQRLGHQLVQTGLQRVDDVALPERLGFDGVEVPHRPVAPIGLADHLRPQTERIDLCGGQSDPLPQLVVVPVAVLDKCCASGIFDLVAAMVPVAEVQHA